MSEQYTNFATSTLNGTINNSVTSLVVTTGSLFPATGNFHILVEDELMLVTARSTNTLTVTRAQEGTAAASHTSGVTVKHTVTVSSLTTYFGDRMTIGGYASRPSGQVGQVYFANDVQLGWLYEGSSWSLIKPVYVPSTKQIDVSGWTSFNLGTSAITNINGYAAFQVQTGTGADNLRGYYKNVPSAPYKARLIQRIMPNVDQFILQGMVLSDATKFFTLSVLGQSSAAHLSVDRYTNSTTYSSGDYRAVIIEQQYIWLTIEDNNTNWLFRYSYDGYNWITVFSVARNTFLTATKVGVFVDRTETTYPSTMEFGYYAYWEE